MTVESENNSLWPSRKSAQDLDTTGCISLSIPDVIYDRRLNGKYVVVKGKLRTYGPNVITLNTCGAAVIELGATTPPILVSGEGG